jgi:uncharacterized protein
MRNFLVTLLVTTLVSCATTPDGSDRLPSGAQDLLVSAKSGSPEAMERIGEAFHFGQGVNKDMAAAMIWYRRAADKGLASAQDYVGLFYAGGLGGVQEDCKESIRWFLKAAKSGNIESKNNAAWMFATCIDARHRDGKEAVRLAQEAIFQLGPTASYVGTLAAAFAEIGEFEKAIELQEESLSRMRLDRASEEMIAEANTRMNFFRERKPWRGSSFENPQLYRHQ